MKPTSYNMATGIMNSNTRVHALGLDIEYNKSKCPWQLTMMFYEMDLCRFGS